MLKQEAISRLDTQRGSTWRNHLRYSQPWETIAFKPTETSFTNDICAARVADPNLVDALCIDVKAGAGTERLLGRALVLGIGDGELAVENQMGGQAVMRVRRIVSISGLVSHRGLQLAESRRCHLRAIRPGEHVAEAPVADFLLSFPLALCGHGRRVRVRAVGRRIL